MFDISFSELMLCFVVALVVLGPERLPGVARAVGRWAGKARGYMRNLSAELDRETSLGEMKQQFQDAQRILRDQSHEVQRQMDEGVQSVRKETEALKGALDPTRLPEPVPAPVESAPAPQTSAPPPLPSPKNMHGP